ncbi:MAG: sugar phosphate isomerase/epimerase [Rhizobiales bacterium]|nr:sugar phosphate isomerase/epimerase [Hyphomicrobiales bacterium]
MKYGFNLLLWTGHVTEEHLPIFKALKKAGYDGVEFPLFDGTPDHYARLGEHLDKLGLERSTVSVLGSGHNPLSPDKAQQQAALERAKWAVDCTAALGGTILAGPMHSELGYFSGGPATKQEHQRGVSFHRRAGDHAAKKNVRFAVEALNRFECYFLNTMEQLCEHLDAVDHPHVKAMYDTFHSNIEEKDPVAAVKAIKKHMIHVHVSENDRGTPGKGHVPWAETFKAIKAAKYDGWMTIEAFGRAIPALAAATRVWRDFFPNKEEVYKVGLKTMKQGMARAR